MYVCPVFVHKSVAFSTFMDVAGVSQKSADAVRLPSLLQCRSMTTRPALADMTESLQGGKSPSFLISAGGVLQGLLTRICLF